MLCPVCKTNCGDNAVCVMCGFDQLKVEFLSRDDATYWMNNVVVPYKEKWLGRQNVASVDWNQILCSQKEVRYFFDVTIPAAASKNKVLGHTLLVCPYRRLRDCFVEQLKRQLPYRNVRDNSVFSKMRIGDFAATLSCLQPNDICILNIKNLPSEKLYYDGIQSAFKEFALPVTLGKGPSAQSVRIDLPEFTWLAIVDTMADVPERYISIFDNVIEIKVKKQDICKYEVISVVNDLGMKMDERVIDLISQRTRFNPKEAVSCVKRMNDYLVVKNIEGDFVTEELAGEIISKFM